MDAAVKELVTLSTPISTPAEITQVRIISVYCNLLCLAYSVVIAFSATYCDENADGHNS